MSLPTTTRSGAEQDRPPSRDTDAICASLRSAAGTVEGYSCDSQSIAIAAPHGSPIPTIRSDRETTRAGHGCQSAGQPFEYRPHFIPPRYSVALESVPAQSSNQAGISQSTTTLTYSCRGEIPRPDLGNEGPEHTRQGPPLKFPPPYVTPDDPPTILSSSDSPGHTRQDPPLKFPPPYVTPDYPPTSLSSSDSPERIRQGPPLKFPPPYVTPEYPPALCSSSSTSIRCTDRTVTGLLSTTYPAVHINPDAPAKPTLQVHNQSLGQLQGHVRCLPRKQQPRERGRIPAHWQQDASASLSHDQLFNSSPAAASPGGEIQPRVYNKSRKARDAVTFDGTFDASPSYLSEKPEAANGRRSHDHAYYPKGSSADTEACHHSQIDAGLLNSHTSRMRLRNFFKRGLLLSVLVTLSFLLVSLVSHTFGLAVWLRSWSPDFAAKVDRFAYAAGFGQGISTMDLLPLPGPISDSKPILCANFDPSQSNLWPMHQNEPSSGAYTRESSVSFVIPLSSHSIFTHVHGPASIGEIAYETYNPSAIDLDEILRHSIVGEEPHGVAPMSGEFVRVIVEPRYQVMAGLGVGNHTRPDEANSPGWRWLMASNVCLVRQIGPSGYEVGMGVEIMSTAPTGEEHGSGEPPLKFNIQVLFPKVKPAEVKSVAAVEGNPRRSVSTTLPKETRNGLNKSQDRGRVESFTFSGLAIDTVIGDLSETDIKEFKHRTHAGDIDAQHLKAGSVGLNSGGHAGIGDIRGVVQVENKLEIQRKR